MSKYYALQKDVFDISKVTVVGSPTITSDGVASGFSGINYCYTPIIINPQNTVKFVGRFTMPINTVNAYGAIFYYGTSSSNRFWLQRTPENYLQLASVDGSYRCLSKTPLTLGTIYDFEAIYTNGLLTLKYKLLEDKDFIEVTSNQTGILGSISSVKLYLGVYDNGNTPFTGSIDLKEFKIYVDNQLIYTPTKPTYLLERRKEGYDPSKFTIVGSPTITDDGVAGGFSKSDYINCGNVLNPASVNELEIKARVKLESTSKSERFIGIITGVGSTNGISINRYAGSSSILRFLVQNNANSKVQIDVPIQLGIYNDLRLKWNSTNNILFAYLNEILIGTAILAEGITGDYSNAILQLGALQTNYNEFLNGSIDLPSISITVDGKEVFTGAKEVYYALRR